MQKLIVFLFAFGVSLISLCSCRGKNDGGSSVKNLPEVEWVYIKGGSFEMGSNKGERGPFEYPKHEETLSSFYVLKTEVTVEQFDACVDEKVCWRQLEADPKLSNWDKSDRKNHPMNFVDWYQATVFCAWLGARLPTEAEWEYMARSGGKEIEFTWGNEPADCDRAALDEEGAINCGKWKGSTSPVCSRPAGNSEQGVCDLIGNVHEWTADWFYPSYDKSTFKEVPKMYNGATKEWAHNKVLRGGGIGSTAGQRAGDRVLHDPPFKYVGMGFRCVK